MKKQRSVTGVSAATGDSVTIKWGVPQSLWRRALTAVFGWTHRPRRRVSPVADASLTYSKAGTYTIGVSGTAPEAACSTCVPNAACSGYIAVGSCRDRSSR